MRRTFGLTALLLLTLAVLAAAGCTGAADSGAGVLQPFQPGTPGVPVTPTTSPSIVPLPTGTGTAVPSLSRPTRIEIDEACQDLWFLDGFGLTNGRIGRARLDTVNGISQTDPTSVQFFNLQDSGGAQVVLNSPTWLDMGTHPTNGQFFIVVADGGVNTTQGRIIVIQFTNPTPCTYSSTATATIIAEGLTNPLAVDWDGRYIWWTEHVAGAGRVMRHELGATNPVPPNPVEFMTGLQFPAGIQSNGAFVAFAESLSNRYVVSRIDLDTYPAQVNSPDTIAVTAVPGDPQLLRPWELVWTTGNTFVALDGFGLTPGAGPAGAGLGNLRYYTGPGTGSNLSGTLINMVQGGLTEPVGLSVALDTTGRTDVVFKHPVAGEGVRRIAFTPSASPTIVLTDVMRPGFIAGFDTAAAVRGTGTGGLPLQIGVWDNEGTQLGTSQGTIFFTVENF